MIDMIQSPNTPLVCKAIQDLQVSRRFLIALRVKQTNACGALIRRAFNFSPEMAEVEREKVRKRSTAIVSNFLSGKPIADADMEVVEAYRNDLTAVAAALRPLLLQEETTIKTMVKMARSLPVAPWADGVLGFGDKALAVVVGETGDLSNYPHPRMVWKRLGLAPYEGHAASTWRTQSRRPRALEGEEWTTLGYKPSRRAEMHAFIGDPMSRHQLISAEKSGTEFGSPKGPYGTVYVQRREKTKIDHPDWTPAHARADALRIMTKALIEDLWSTWRTRPTANYEAGK
jgi:hypothetical protein